MHTTLICDTENDRTYNNNQNPLKKRYVITPPRTHPHPSAKITHFY